jgi:[ribosomal protein S5]-alanine N-acetyltransferase
MPIPPQPGAFPELATERLLLRQINPPDQQAVFKGLSDPEVIKYYGVWYQTYKDTQVQMDWFDRLWRQKEGVWWAICLRENPDCLVGACGFNNHSREHRQVEMGYWLMPPWWGKGIMGEAIPFILRYAFTSMEVHRVAAVVESGNEASVKLLARLGFCYEGTHHECELKHGRFIDLSYYALLKRNFIF